MPVKTGRAANVEAGSMTAPAMETTRATVRLQHLSYLDLIHCCFSSCCGELFAVAQKSRTWLPFW
jgi:hypothetical protein